MKKTLKCLLRFCEKSGDRPYSKSDGVSGAEIVVPEAKINVLPKTIDSMKKDYAELFLRKREGTRKRQTYISLELHTKLTKILAVVANDVTVPTFIDNVLMLHMEQYCEEINNLYEKRFEKPF